MSKTKLLPITLILLLISGCQFQDSSSKVVLCENYFVLTSDFNHRFPDQDNYMVFIKNGYYETFYSNQKNGYNCHYYLEFMNGDYLDEWGTYFCDGVSLTISFSKLGEKKLTFCNYASSTIDFHLIDTMNYDGKEYFLVYQARYLYSAKG